MLENEPLQPEHLERHPFGKVPVVDHNGLRLLETGAITRYLDEVLDGPSFIPDNPIDRARMDMAISLFDSYGYLNLVTVPGYHLFRDLVGNPDEAALRDAIEASRLVLTEIMKIRGDSPWIAGDKPSLADFYLGPVCFYLSLVDESRQAFDVPGFEDWWAACNNSIPSMPPSPTSARPADHGAAEFRGAAPGYRVKASRADNRCPRRGGGSDMFLPREFCITISATPQRTPR